MVVCLVAVLLALVLPFTTTATEPAQGHGHGKYGVGVKSDDLPHPLGKMRRSLRQRALLEVIRGNAYGRTHEVARGQFVELERLGEDSIWTVIAEFGDLESPFGSLAGGLPGPQHNQIPEPDREFDNSTIWAADFDQAYYEDLLFSEAPDAISMRNFYIEQSSNRYTVNGDVTDWAQVPYRTRHYGADWCGSIICSTTWWFVRDSVDDWYQGQIAAGMTADEIDDYLSQFDVWDRYDFDGDGNFDEPDGYIDHFQSVHAGEGQEAGGGIYGSDAIWSHRWYVQLVPWGGGGPTLDDGTVVPFGGTPVGGSKYWIGDYTIEPENGGVGVFAHEFGHDLGLPDLYDTSGATNTTGFWTLMSSGSWLNDGTVDIGSKPSHMGNWEKFQLGWLNYEVAYAGSKSEHKLGPAETNTKQAQGLFVVLPDKEVVTEIGDAYSGDYFYFSGADNNLDNWMSQEFVLPSGSTLTAKVKYDIETDWDYAYVTISTDGGPTWTTVETNLSTSADPNGQNEGNGITGNSGGAWITLTADLSAYTGPVVLSFRYWTDGFVVFPGFQIDDIEVSGHPIDDAESGDPWTYDPPGGFRRTDGTETSFHFNAYVAEFRQYRDFDESLDTGPYNFGFLDDPALGNWVERFPYQDGLLISYWDTSQANNNVGTHPGEGLILPIDAHPGTMSREGYNPGQFPYWVGRVPTYDSTFGLEPTEAITLHINSVANDYPSLPAVPIFDDNIQYYNPETPWNGVINPHTGTQIRIKSVSAHGSFMQVEVRPSK
jgi:immune inhibitor A